MCGASGAPGDFLETERLSENDLSGQFHFKSPHSGLLRGGRRFSSEIIDTFYKGDSEVELS